MTWPACGADDGATGPAELACGTQGRRSAASEREAATDLQIRRGGDGSFSLWSESFGEGFHSGRGALREARETFVVPSQLERFPAGKRLRVVEVCVGTGSNLAMLLERCGELGIELEWGGLELDPAPLKLALAHPEFRGQWQPQTLITLEELLAGDGWRQAGGMGQMLWGDARQRLPELLREQRGQVDLVWHDAFSPQHCPQLWTVEVLGSLGALLAPEGRWISYCSAAAVREGLRLANLNLAALTPQSAGPGQKRGWSGGTLASREELLPTAAWRPLAAMELEHLASSAGESYRDPTSTASAATIHAYRREAQAASQARGERTSSNGWRKRWGV